MGAVARPATPADADEFVRLRVLMLESMGRPAEVETRRDEALRQLTVDLGHELVAYVVDDPDTPGRLAAGGAAQIQRHFPSAFNPTGWSAHVLSMSTDPAHRRRGHARRILEALVDDLRSRGIHRIDLYASPDGEPLYRAFGFEPDARPHLILTDTRRATTTPPPRPDPDNDP